MSFNIKTSAIKALLEEKEDINIPYRQYTISIIYTNLSIQISKNMRNVQFVPDIPKLGDQGNPNILLVG
jgi:hypothetical protein